MQNPPEPVSTGIVFCTFGPPFSGQETCQCAAGLPDGLFSNQKSKFG
jgi:hypothetical protein